MYRVTVGSTEGRCKLRVGLPRTRKAAREGRSFLSPGKLAETAFTGQLSLPHLLQTHFSPAVSPRPWVGRGG